MRECAMKFLDAVWQVLFPPNEYDRIHAQLAERLEARKRWIRDMDRTLHGRRDAE